MTASSSDDSSRADELHLERVFDAPVPLVFSIWREREHMMQWLGPKGFRCTALELDFRPGGAWRACIEAEGHGQSWMAGEYIDIVENERIVYTFAWLDGPERPGAETRITVTFEDRDGKTLQRFHQAPFASVESRDSHVGGWSECFDREGAYAESLARGGQR